jgi:Domain of unknown function (DUF4340)
MNTASAPHKARARMAIILLVCAAATTFAALASVWVQRAVSGEQTIAGKVLPGFAADMPQVRTITIAARGVTYNLVRRGTLWVMPERGNYPIAASALSDLAKSLSDLEYKTARTSDPSQFAKLGVDDPGPDSDGAMITIKGETGQILDSLHVGQKEDALFVRKAGSNDVFEATGKLPDFLAPARWLDLKVLDVTAETIASVSGEHAGEGRYDIVRRPDGGFAPVGGTPNVTATTTAIALTKWAPVDVLAASELTSDPLATHVTTLRDGLVVSLTAYEQSGRYWVGVSADANSPDQTDAATKLNQRTDGWAFGLDATAFADVTFKRDAILNGPAHSAQ